MIKIDKYSIKARLFPTIVTIVLPLVVFNYFYTFEEFTKFFETIWQIKILGSLTFQVVIFFFLSQFTRFIGKEVVQNYYFDGESQMPTTNYLLYSNSEYSESYKKDFAEKIKTDFNVTLLPKEIELQDEKEARRKIVEAISLVRKKLHGNEFLLQHNIEYGTVRNFIGGSIVGMLLCLFNALFFYFVAKNNFAITVSLCLGLVYLIALLSSKALINRLGNAYAKILFREYFGQEN